LSPVKTENQFATKTTKTFSDKSIFLNTATTVLLLLLLLLQMEQNVKNKEMLKNQRNVINSNICLQIVGVVVVKAAYF